MKSKGGYITDGRRRNAMEINIEEHLGLARKIASEFSKNINCKYTYDELESQAFLGLVKAANRFEEERGVKFSTYAVPVIRGEILRMYRDDKWYNSKRGCPHEILSLNVKMSSEEKQEEILTLLKDDTDYEGEAVDNLLIKELSSRLKDDEKEIIYLYFYNGLRQPQIAEIIGLTQATISRKIRNALKKMRCQLSENTMSYYSI